MARSRLTPERESELYGAVIDLLGEVGYEALTMDAVAARTRSSKATLYRQWGSKPELVAKALRHTKPVRLDEIDTGSLRGDFHAVLQRTDDCQMEKNSALMRGLSHAVHNNPDLFQALRELLIEPEINGLGSMLPPPASKRLTSSSCLTSRASVCDWDSSVVRISRCFSVTGP